MTSTSAYRSIVVFAFILLSTAMLPVFSAYSQTVSPEKVQSAQDTQYEEIKRYYDREIERAATTREEFWDRDFSSLGAYRRSIEPYREELFDMLGGNVYEKTPLEPREELIAEFPTHKAYRVWLRAFDRVHAYGILLVPTGEGPFPGLVTVHGMGGTPEGVTGLTEAADYHNRFGLQAVKRGYVVFAPLDMNSAEKRSWLDRQAIMVGQRLQALEQFKMLRIVDYLAGRNDVDAEHIGAYGISWGGRTVMYMAALDPRVAATAISGHFNDLIPKMLEPSPHYTAYIETDEVYAFFWRHAQRFTDADVVSLICPRPVLIEQGREDRVAYWKMSRRAFDEVESIYERLGIAERAAYEVYDGAHEVFGSRTFDFLDEWLKH
jgi:dienelactone hydrolase